MWRPGLGCQICVCISWRACTYIHEGLGIYLRFFFVAFFLSVYGFEGENIAACSDKHDVVRGFSGNELAVGTRCLGAWRVLELYRGRDVVCWVGTIFQSIDTHPLFVAVLSK